MKHPLTPLRRISAALAFAAILVMAYSESAFAQFQKTYPKSDRSHSECVRRTTDGGFITVGILRSSYAVYIVLEKTDAAGVVQWSRRLLPASPLSGTEQDFGFAVRQLVDRCDPQGYFIVGTTEDQTPGRKSILVIRTDNNGNILFRKRYSGDEGDAVAYNFEIHKAPESPFNDHLIVTGYIDATVTSLGVKKGQKAFLMKLDLNGTLQWCRKFGIAYPQSHQNDQNVGFAVQHIGDGYVVTGYTNTTGNFNDKLPFIVRTGLTGNPVWGYAYSTPLVHGVYTNAVGKSIRLMPDGGFVVVGMAEDQWSGEDILLLRTNSTGGTIWMKHYDGYNSSTTSHNDYGWEIHVNAGNNTFDITGTTNFSQTSSGNEYLMSTNIDFSGNVIGATKYTYAPVARTAATYVGIDREIGVGADTRDNNGKQILTAEMPTFTASSEFYLVNTAGLTPERNCVEDVTLRQLWFQPFTTDLHEYDDDCNAYTLSRESPEEYTIETACPEQSLLRTVPSISVEEDTPAGRGAAAIPGVLRNGEPLAIRYRAEAGKGVTIRVSNTVGEVIHSGTAQGSGAESSATIDASSWTSGTYFVETIIDGTSSTATVNVVR